MIQRKPLSRVAMGVTIATVLISLDFILQQTVHPLPDSMRYLCRLVLTFAAIVLACILYSKQANGHRGFGEVFAYGFRTTALVAFLMASYTFILIKFILPAPSPAEMKAAVQAIEQQGNALPEEATQQAAKLAANRWIVYVSLSIFVSVIPGLLGSLAGGALTKKNR